MSEVVIRNPQFMDRLNEISDEFFTHKDYDNKKYWTYRIEEDIDQGEYFCSREYLEECLQRDKLVGAPDRYFGQPIAKMCKVESEEWDPYKQKVKFDFAQEIAHTLLHFLHTIPGGYVGWHTNFDANAYQILFTWSDGNGYFRYYDKEKDEIITLPDVKGWQCRHYYFGSDEEPENLCWHSAYSGVRESLLHISL